MVSFHKNPTSHWGIWHYSDIMPSIWDGELAEESTGKLSQATGPWWDNNISDQIMLKQFCYTLHTIGPFVRMVVLCRSLCALSIPCGDIYHLWEMDQDYRIIVLLYWVMSSYDMIIPLVMRLRWYLYAALSFISHLKQSMDDIERMLSQLLRTLDVLELSKPAYSYCYVSLMCPRWSGFESDNIFSIIPHTYLPQDWIVQSNRVCVRT